MAPDNHENQRCGCCEKLWSQWPFDWWQRAYATGKRTSHPTAFQVDLCPNKATRNSDRSSVLEKKKAKKKSRKKCCRDNWNMNTRQFSDSIYIQDPINYNII